MHREPTDPHRNAPAGDGPAPSAAARRLPLALRLALLLVVPLVLIGPSLAPGHRFLPQAPVVYEPLASEYPGAAARAAEGLNHWTGDRVFPVLGDQLELRERVLAGRGWLHDERSGLGQPLFGNVIHGPLYPPNLLLLALPPDRAAAPLAMLALLLAGAGLWALTARLGLAEPACAVGALCVQGLGWGVANLHYGMKVDAALWLPWCLWAVEGLRTGDRRAGPWLALFAGASSLAGFPPIAVFTLASTALVAVLRLRSGRAFGRLTLGLALGVGLGAAQLGATLEASAQSYRTPKDRSALLEEAAAPGASLGLVAPGLFGRPTEPTPPFGPVAAWWVSDPEAWERVQLALPLEWDPYAGVIVVVLAAGGLLVGGRRALPPALLLVLAHGFAQGWPGVNGLYALPGLDGGAPTRALSVAWIAWPWLAAVGLDAGLREARARWVLGVLGAAVLVLGAAGTAVLGDGRALIEGQERALAEAHGRPLEEVRLVLAPEDSATAARRLSAGLALLAGAGLTLALGAALAASPRRRAALWLLPLAVAAYELARHSTPHLRPRDLGGVALFPPSAALDAVGATTGDGRLIRFDPSPSGLEAVTRLARPNLPWTYGLSDVSSYVAFTPRATVDFFRAVDPRTQVRSGVGRLPDLASLDHPNLDAARVTCVLSVGPLEHPRLEPGFARPGFHVHRRRLDPDVPPRPPLRPSYAGARAGFALAFLAAIGLAVWTRGLRRPRVQA